MAGAAACCGCRAGEGNRGRPQRLPGPGRPAARRGGTGDPLLGFAALVLSLVVLVTMLLSGYLVAAAGLDRRDEGAPTGCGWPILGPAERPRLVRIMNLSRAAGRPVAVRMLFCEVDEALAVEPLASWPPLRDLRGVLSDNDDDAFTPFGAAPPSGGQGTQHG